MQSHNRAVADASASTASPKLGVAIGVSGVGSGGRGSTATNPRPPSLDIRHEFAEALAEGGKGGDTKSNPDTGGGGGTAFNLLGLPPSPAPLSAATGASAWSRTGDGGVWGGGGEAGDKMAGQVRAPGRDLF